MENHIFYYQSLGTCLMCAVKESTELLQVMIWVAIAVDTNGSAKTNKHTQRGEKKKKDRKRESFLMLIGYLCSDSS